MILFTGDDLYRLIQELRKWQDMFIMKYGEHQLTRIDVPRAENLLHVVTDLDSLPMFTEKKMLILDGFPFPVMKCTSAQEQFEEKLIAILETLSDDVVVVCVSPKPDMRRKSAKKLQSIADIRAYLMQDSWSKLQKRLQAIMDRSLAQWCFEQVKADPYRAYLEVEKLETFAASKPITRGIIEQLITPTLEATVFQATNALADRNVAGLFHAIDILERFGEEAPKVFYLLLWQLEQLLYLKDCLGKGMQISDISTLTGMNPRAASMNAKVIGKFSKEELRKLLNGLYDIERGIKTGKYTVSGKFYKNYFLLLREVFIRQFVVPSL